MAEFKISAPGKIILYGEHAVVYGKTAVAASLNLRTTVKFVELSRSLDSEDLIKIEFHNDNDQLHDYVKDFVDSIADVLDKDDNDSIIQQQKSSLRAFFYLLVHIAYEEQMNVKDISFYVDLSTELIVNAGLGSSASFAVCLAACFLHWSRLQKGEHNDFNKDELDKIAKYALNCEQIMHESPSGIDNSVCTYGSIIKFQDKKVVDMLSHVPNLKIILVNTNVVRNTKDQVKRVAEMKRLYPLVITPVLDSIDALSNKAWQTLTEISKTEGNFAENFSITQEWYTTLSTLIHMNQGLLNALDVSHPKLEMICTMAWKYSYAGKLTGGGGGGYVYILLPSDVDDVSISVLSKELEKKDFDVMITSLGGTGVKIEHDTK